MADKQKSKKKEAESESAEGVLATTAKAIGTAAGKVAALAGVKADADAAPQPKAAKPQKLQKSNKPHLPRRLKKAEQKKAAKASAVQHSGANL
jgi:hypothetical protein